MGINKTKDFNVIFFAEIKNNLLALSKNGLEMSASSLYGSEAVGWLINIITKKPIGVAIVYMAKAFIQSDGNGWATTSYP